MTPDWKLTTGQREGRGDVARRIQNSRSKSPTLVEIPRTNWLQDLQRNISNILRLEAAPTPQQTSQIYPKDLLNSYYKILLDDTFATADIQSVSFLQERLSNLTDIKNQISILINKAALINHKNSKRLIIKLVWELLSI